MAGLADILPSQFLGRGLVGSRVIFQLGAVATNSREGRRNTRLVDEAGRREAEARGGTAVGGFVETATMSERIYLFVAFLSIFNTEFSRVGPRIQDEFVGVVNVGMVLGPRHFDRWAGAGVMVVASVNLRRLVAS